MPNDTDGLVIARERIAEEARDRTGFLDLGRLGLAALPEELFALTHLCRLNLGAWFHDDAGQEIEARSDIAPNSVGSDLAKLVILPDLLELSLCDASLSILYSVARLSGLQSLDCSDTQVSNLAPLSGLGTLQSLDCSDTPVSDLAPLSGLGTLQSLNCSGTQVSDLAPLSGLGTLQSLDCSGTQV